MSRVFAASPGVVHAPHSREGLDVRQTYATSLAWACPEGSSCKYRQMICCLLFKFFFLLPSQSCVWGFPNFALCLQFWFSILGVLIEDNESLSRILLGVPCVSEMFIAFSFKVSPCCVSGLNLICSVNGHLGIKVLPLFFFCISDHSILIVFGKSEFFVDREKLTWRNQREGEVWMDNESSVVGFAPGNWIWGYWYSCSVCLKIWHYFHSLNVTGCCSSQASIISLLKCLRVCLSPCLTLTSFSHGCPPRSLKFSIILVSPCDDN